METAEQLSKALRERFGDLWRRLGAAGEGDHLTDELLDAYREPHRHYHGMDHLRDCLQQLDAAPAAGGDRDLAEVALWFHDAVYVPGAVDNEIRSAERALRAFAGAYLPEVLGREVARLIRLTDHAAAAEDPLGALVCDVDLSILGRPPAEFAEYDKRIRAEYAGVAEPLYRTGRASVLARLLARESLYRSPHFKERYELAARRNLARSLAMLMPKADPE